jgi:hypothetical protein
MPGEYWIGLSLTNDTGLILAERVSLPTDCFLAQLVVTTEGKTDCEHWNTDGCSGYKRMIPEEFDHQVVKQGTQRLERTNTIVRQQTRRWHRHQNKEAKVCEQTKVTARLVVGYFNWIWEHSRLGTTAAQRAGLTDDRWTWNDLITYPTVL